MLAPFDKDRLDLQKDAPDVFVKFCKVLKQLKLEFNAAIFITGIENTFD